jgi:hypothetical protein
MKSQLKEEREKQKTQVDSFLFAVPTVYKLSWTYQLMRLLPYPGQY